MELRGYRHRTDAQDGSMDTVRHDEAQIKLQIRQLQEQLRRLTKDGYGDMRRTGRRFDVEFRAGEIREGVDIDRASRLREAHERFRTWRGGLFGVFFDGKDLEDFLETNSNLFEDDLRTRGLDPAKVPSVEPLSDEFPEYPYKRSCRENLCPSDTELLAVSGFSWNQIRHRDPRRILYDTGLDEFIRYRVDVTRFMTEEEQAAWEDELEKDRRAPVPNPDPVRRPRVAGLVFRFSERYSAEELPKKCMYHDGVKESDRWQFDLVVVPVWDYRGQIYDVMLYFRWNRDKDTAGYTNSKGNFCPCQTAQLFYSGIEDRVLYTMAIVEEWASAVETCSLDWENAMHGREYDTLH